VTDLVDGLVRMMATGHEVTGPVNLGNPEESRIGDLAAMVVELVSSSSPIVHVPLPPDDPRRRRPDISLARELLDWQPSMPLREGLAHTVDYFAAEASGGSAQSMARTAQTDDRASERTAGRPEVTSRS
jgi:UDP-glucuronate decarboxylase